MAKPDAPGGAASTDPGVPVDMRDPDARARAIAATLLPGFTGTRLPETLRQRLSDGLGGVCLFGANVDSVEQLRRLDDEILEVAPFAVIAIDEEGGDVTRVDHADGSPYPGAALLGRLDDEALTEHVGREVGRALRRVGCTLDLAPVVDVNSQPDNPVIGVRSFGADAALVARHAAAWTRGIRSAGIGACAKHFPGHGDTTVDSHLALPVVERTLPQLRERELPPFAAAIAAGAPAVMTSHIVLPHVDSDLLATFSSRILQGILRGELGFRGVIVTDALDMKGASGELGVPEEAVRALASGCDLLCLGQATSERLIDDIVGAVEVAIDTGRLAAERVSDAAGRVRALGHELARLRAQVAWPAGAPFVDDVVPLDRLQKAFDVREGAVDALRAAGPFAVLRIETAANIAVGPAPWGPFAQAAAEPDAPDSRAWAAHPQLVLWDADADDGTAPDRAGDLMRALPADRAVVVIGRALHRHPFARRVVDGLRAERTTLVVDMGWPSDDRRYADVATFGASRLVGRALMALLEPAGEPERPR